MRAGNLRTLPWGIALVALTTACRAPSPPEDLSARAGGPVRLPTGGVLDPAGRSIPVGSFPMSLAAAPAGNRLAVLLGGYREQGIEIVDVRSGVVVQTLVQPAAFIGLRFDRDGRQLFASGGNQDLVYRYAWENGAARLLDSLVLAPKSPKQPGTRYPAGLDLSPDGRRLYVAENIADSLAVIDLATGEVVQRLPAGRYPYDVVVARDGTVYVSAWGGFEVRVFHPSAAGLEPRGAVQVGRHPSALALSADGTRLFAASASTDQVAVVDTRLARVIARLNDGVPGAPPEGSTPNALRLSADGTRLLVAEGDNNAVAVFALSAATSGIPMATGPDRLAGRIPVGWYPTALALLGDTLVVANAKGRGSAPNGGNGPAPGRPSDPRGYTLGQLSGTLTVLPGSWSDTALSALSKRVAQANGWGSPRPTAPYPPFTHVIYIIKENRTYDQVLGDLPQGDGDTSLVFFGRSVSPNHHALAERFGLFDRFLVNAEVSPDGHNWSTASYATDYLEKTVPSNYSKRGRSYDYEGANRGVRPAPGEDAAEPAQGYLWDLAQRKGLTFRNFGEFVAPERGRGAGSDSLPASYRGLKPFLDAHTDSSFPGFDMQVPDQHRADLWLRALQGWARAGEMPALQILRLPNDHTMGARAGALTPRAYMADNDLALGRVIEALSRSPFWRNTVVFVVEDDAQNGADHVDSHRAPFLVISAYNQPAVWHRFTNTTDVLATIEQILSLEPLSHFDAYSRPLHGIFASEPDLTPYVALRPAVPLDERNAAGAPGAAESSGLDFHLEDLAEEHSFNLALWLAIKGPLRPYPGTRRLTAANWARP